MNVLVVEDEFSLAEEISNYLKDNHIICDQANSYNDAISILNKKEFAVVLIDLRLPDGHGLNLIGYIKRKKIKTGIIVISAIDELDMRLKSLDSGADDFMIKPFHLSELNSRVKALIRRNFHDGDNIITHHEISIDAPRQVVKINDTTVTLTTKEYELLLYFISNKGKVITKEAIAYSVWSSHSDMDLSNEIIYTHIKNLRKKLVSNGCSDYIKSIYGIGYKFEE